MRMNSQGSTYFSKDCVLVQVENGFLLSAQFTGPLFRLGTIPKPPLSRKAGYVLETGYIEYKRERNIFPN